ncbi:transglycosylase SLT domain-containing protein [Bacillus sp. SCS-151]|uniref:transglycosylase SLT domain-containing protein n=1 Tax=Nanhaiella sioensis TaxID=3115293 RepID=UPI003978207F
MLILLKNIKEVDTRQIVTMGLIVTLAILNTVTILNFNKVKAEMKEELEYKYKLIEYKKSEIDKLAKTLDDKESTIENLQGQLSIQSIESISEVKKDDFTFYEEIPLEREIQKYIYEESKSNGLSYELVLAVIKKESNFDTFAVSYNGSSVGLMQINRNNTLGWLADKVGIEKVDPFNPYHSIKMGTWYLGYLKQYWLEQGYSDEDSTKAALLSYLKGKSGSIDYIMKNGLNHDYLYKIIKYINKITG